MIAFTLLFEFATLAHYGAEVYGSHSTVRRSLILNHEFCFQGLKASFSSSGSVQNIYSTPSEPTPTLTFSAYGLTTFEAQYWNSSSWVTGAKRQCDREQPGVEADYVFAGHDDQDQAVDNAHFRCSRDYALRTRHRYLPHPA